MADWITTKEAADLSGYHPDSLRELIRDGKIYAEKKGNAWWVDRKSLLAYICNLRKRGKKRGPKTRH